MKKKTWSVITRPVTMAVAFYVAAVAVLLQQNLGIGKSINSLVVYAELYKEAQNGGKI